MTALERVKCQTCEGFGFIDHGNGNSHTCMACDGSGFVREAPTSKQNLIETIIRDVCELPDYTSPDDQPELLRCTVTELESILDRNLPDETKAECTECVAGGFCWKCGRQQLGARVGRERDVPWVAGPAEKAPAPRCSCGVPLGRRDLPHLDGCALKTSCSDPHGDLPVEQS